MHNLNLYNYYDKSLADINREYLESLKYKPKKKTKSRFDRRHFLALAIILLTGLGVANYLGVFDEPVVETVQAPPPVDTRTEEEKQGYVQIQIFEFADTPTETITEPAVQNDSKTIKSIDNNSIALNNTSSTVSTVDKVNINQTDKKETKKKENKESTAVTKPKEQKKAAPPAPVVVKEYAILFENINENQYNKIKELSSKNNTKLEVVDAYSNTYSVWKVYEKDDIGSQVVDGTSVTHLEDFLTQEDAVEYAAKRNIQALIKQVGITEKSYNIRLCCTNIDKAKNIAQSSNITDRIIKIVREK